MTLPFTAEVGTYTVLVLRLDEYRATGKALPASASFLEPAQADAIREQEKRVLRQVFDDWQIPFERRLKGWRLDSPVFVVEGPVLVGGAYLCDRNEFDDNPARGQLHYLFTAPSARRRGIYSAVFAEAVRRARAWGLEALYVNTDRYLLPEVHLRWGARLWRTIEKESRWSRIGWMRRLVATHPGLRVLSHRLARAWRDLRVPGKCSVG